MRILHTSDWHMNATLGRQPLTDDICRSLSQIAGYLDEHQVDVMLVAGDLFCDRSRPEDLRAAVGKIREMFLPFLQRGGTIVAISGNHDSEVFFETLRDAFDLVAVGQESRSRLDAKGRLYLLPRPKLLRLADSAGQVVQIVALPYPTPYCYLRGDSTNWRSLPERNRKLQQKFGEVLSTLKARLDPRLPSVLLSHIHVRGVNPHNLYQISESDDVVFEPGDIPTAWSYVAYGHIHCPQSVLRGAAHVRYAGSVARLNAGERNDNKSVVLLDIVGNVRQGEPILLPLDSTPFYQIEITDPDNQIPQMKEQYPNAPHALVKYTLHWEPGKHNRNELCRQINTIFPRWYEREERKIGNTSSSIQFTAARMRDVRGTVREYLQARLANDKDKDALLALAEELLVEEVLS